MMFDWTVNLGNLIQIFTVVGGGIWVFAKQSNRISLLSQSILHLEEAQRILNEAFAQLGKILTQVAVQDTRLSMMEKALDEIRHGKGFIEKD